MLQKVGVPNNENMDAKSIMGGANITLQENYSKPTPTGLPCTYSLSPAVHCPGASCIVLGTLAAEIYLKLQFRLA